MNGAGYKLLLFHPLSDGIAQEQNFTLRQHLGTDSFRTPSAMNTENGKVRGSNARLIYPKLYTPVNNTTNIRRQGPAPQTQDSIDSGTSVDHRTFVALRAH